MSGSRSRNHVERLVLVREDAGAVQPRVVLEQLVVEEARRSAYGGTRAGRTDRTSRVTALNFPSRFTPPIRAISSASYS